MRVLCGRAYQDVNLITIPINRGKPWHALLPRFHPARAHPRGDGKTNERNCMKTPNKIQLRFIARNLAVGKSLPAILCLLVLIGWSAVYHHEREPRPLQARERAVSAHLGVAPGVHSPPASPQARSESNSGPRPNSLGNLEIHEHSDTAPAWAVGYGQEFWRLAGASSLSKVKAAPVTQVPPSVDLGEVMERVSHALETNSTDPFPHVRAKGYVARFDGQGLRFSPNAPDGGARQVSAGGGRSAPAGDGGIANGAGVAQPRDRLVAGAASAQSVPEVEAFFHTLTVTSQNQALYTAEQSAADWSALGNTAQALLDEASGLLEHYEARTEGVAVTWVLSKPLRGAGDLSITAELVGLNYIGTTASGHHFADQSGTARVRIGNVTLVDAAGSSWAAESQVVGNQLRVQVPGNVLDEAHYPLAIDPTVSPEFGLDLPAFIGSAPQRAPAVAFNGVNYLVVWDGGLDGQSIYGARMSPAGVPLDPNGIVVSAGHYPAVASVGSDFLVVWNVGYETHGVRVNGAGALSGTETKLGSSTAPDSRPAIAANGSSYLVAWEDTRNAGTTGNDIYGAPESASGALTAGNIAITQASADQEDPSVASNGSGFLVVWADYRNSGTTGWDIFGKQVSSSGVPQGSDFAISTASADQMLPAVAFNGANFLVVWQDGRNSGTSGQDIYGRQVSSSFVPLGSDIPIATEANDQPRPAVAAQGSSYLVVWWQARPLFDYYDIYGRLVASDGTPSSQGSFTIALGGDWNYSPAVSSDGSNFLVVWAGSAGAGPTQVIAVRVTTSGTLLDSTPVLLSTEQDAQYSPAVAANGQNYLVVWEQDRVGVQNVFGARVSADGASILDPDGIPMFVSGNNQVTPAVAASGSQYLVVWTESRSVGTTNIYGTRVSSAGAVSDPGGLLIGSANAMTPKVAGNASGKFLVVWTHNDTNVYGATVTGTSGQVSANFAICALVEQAWYASVASDGQNFLVAWSDYREGAAHIYGTQVTSSGVVTDPNGRVINNIWGDFEFFPAVGFSGGTYLVVWDDGRDSTRCVYGVLVNAAGVPADNVGFRIGPADSPIQRNPVITTCGGNFLVVWAQAVNTSSPYDIYGARVSTAGTVLDTSPFIIATQRNLWPAAASGPNGALVVNVDLGTTPSRVTANAISCATPPDANTLPPSQLLGGAATLNGSVNPNSLPTTAWFEWDTTLSYGNVTPATNVGQGSTPVAISAPLTGLALNTTYHYRVAANNSAGATHGSDVAFTTAAAAPTPPLNAPRDGHTATLLPNGKLLLAGGYNGSCLASTELYEPATGQWRASGAMNVAREFHTTTVLPNGKVLAAGGQCGPGGGSLASAELYDPASETWTPTGGLNIARSGQTATLLPNGNVLVAGGYSSVSGVLVSAELYNPATGTWTPTGSMSTPRQVHSATLLPNGKVLVAGGYNTASGSLATAELYDPATGMWTATGVMGTSRMAHIATLLPNGKVLAAGGYASSYLASAELYDPASGTWAATGAMNDARESHTALLLPNGKVLVAGGYGSSCLASLETYDPGTGVWASLGVMNYARSVHTAALLPMGQVLFAGGYDSVYLASAELYEPAHGAWSATGPLNNARDDHTATLLPNGKVLTAGGLNGSALSGTELYDPGAGTWTAANSMATTRYLHTATLLFSGQVLVAGGYNGSAPSVPSAELFDPLACTWTTSGALNTARYSHTATLLPNGQVLVAAGYGQSSWLSSAELYDPATGTWSVTGPLSASRGGHTATLLPNGKVLVAAGYNGSYLASAELYDPATRTWTPTGPLTTARSVHTMTLLPNGRVLVAGGTPDGASALASAELFDPSTGTWAATGPLRTPRVLHTATLLPSGKVLVAGGFDGSSYLSSAELYDPATGVWTSTGALNTPRFRQVATLLPNGNVLLAGGYQSGWLSSSELYDSGLGFSPSWQPQIATITSPLNPGAGVTLTGSRFRGVSEGSGGNRSQDSPADYPVLQLRSLDSGQTVFLLAAPSANWSATSFNSAPVSGFPPGYALATLFVNGIPSVGSFLRIAPAPTPIIVGSPAKLPGGAIQFSFINVPGASFTILAASDPSLPLANWTVLGPATEISSGRFQFTDSQAGVNPRRFYRVRSP